MAPRAKLGRRISKFILGDTVIDISHRPDHKKKKAKPAPSQSDASTSSPSSPAPDILHCQEPSYSRNDHLPIDEEATPIPSLQTIISEPSTISTSDDDNTQNTIDFDGIFDDFEGNNSFFDFNEEFDDFGYGDG